MNTPSKSVHTANIVAKKIEDEATKAANDIRDEVYARKLLEGKKKYRWQEVWGAVLKEKDSIYGY